MAAEKKGLKSKEGPLPVDRLSPEGLQQRLADIKAKLSEIALESDRKIKLEISKLGKLIEEIKDLSAKKRFKAKLEELIEEADLALTNFEEAYTESTIKEAPEVLTTEEIDEQTRIYENYLMDPAVRSALSLKSAYVEDFISGINMGNATAGKMSAEQSARNQRFEAESLRRAELRAWKDFAKKYPEKAEAYSKNDKDIQEALESVLAEAASSASKVLRTPEEEAGGVEKLLITELPEDMKGQIELIVSKGGKAGEAATTAGEIFETEDSDGNPTFNLVTAKEDFAVNEIFRNPDGSYTVTTEKNEFRFEPSKKPAEIPAAPIETIFGQPPAEEVSEAAPATIEPAPGKPAAAEVVSPEIPPASIETIFSQTPAPEAALSFDARIELYRAKLTAEGRSKEEIEKALSVADRELNKENSEVRKGVGSMLDSLVTGVENQPALEALAKETGLPVGQLQLLIGEQKAEIAAAATKIVSEKKDTGLERTGKIATYMAAGSIFSRIPGIGSVLVGTIMAGIRVADNALQTKRKEDDIRQTNLELTGAIAKDGEARAKAAESLITRISQLKQEQISATDPAIARIAVLKEQLFAISNPEERQRIESRINIMQRQQASVYAEQALNNIKSQYPEMSPEAAQVYAMAVGQFYMDDSYLSLENDKYENRNKGFFTKLSERIAKNPVFSKVRDVYHSAFSNNKTMEKATTVGVFAAAGILARSVPVLRNILLGYAGTKAGEGIGQILAKKDMEQLRDLTPAELSKNPELLARARTQLKNPDYLKKNPVQAAEIQKLVDVTRQRELLSPELRKLMDVADQQNKTTEQRQKELSEAFAIKGEAKDSERRKIWIGRIIGGAAGILAAEYSQDVINWIKGKLIGTPVIAGHTQPIAETPAQHHADAAKEAAAVIPPKHEVVPAAIAVEGQYSKGQNPSKIIEEMLRNHKVSDQVAEKFEANTLKEFQEKMHDLKLKPGLGEKLLQHYMDAKTPEERAKAAADLWGEMNKGAGFQQIGDSYAMTDDGKFLTAARGMKGAGWYVDKIGNVHETAGKQLFTDADGNIYEKTIKGAAKVGKVIAKEKIKDLAAKEPETMTVLTDEDIMFDRTNDEALRQSFDMTPERSAVYSKLIESAPDNYKFAEIDDGRIADKLKELGVHFKEGGIFSHDRLVLKNGAEIDLSKLPGGTHDIQLGIQGNSLVIEADNKARLFIDSAGKIEGTGLPASEIFHTDKGEISFDFKANGAIADFDTDIKAPDVDLDKMLVPDWSDKVPYITDSTEVFIRENLQDVANQEATLKQLEALGLGNTREAIHVRRLVREGLAEMAKRYGNIVKPIE